MDRECFIIRCNGDTVRWNGFQALLNKKARGLFTSKRDVTVWTGQHFIPVADGLHPEVAERLLERLRLWATGKLKDSHNFEVGEQLALIKLGVEPVKVEMAQQATGPHVHTNALRDFQEAMNRQLAQQRTFPTQQSFKEAVMAEKMRRATLKP